jgi:signal transduction histidine kinase
LKDASVLIVSDDTGFGRTVVARWQAEPSVPEITLVTGDLWQSVNVSGQDLVIVGPVRDKVRRAVFSALSVSPAPAAVYVAQEEKDASSVRAEHRNFLIVRRQDGWLEALILVSTEALRRMEAAGRARRAESVALACQREATLGRYMLEMRPSVNNALTSVLGNADLLLLNPAQISGEHRQQIQTIRTMALRLNEIMQRFASLVSEMRAGDIESHGETEVISQLGEQMSASRIMS